MAFITTTADNISSGGAITGDLTIEGDLTVDGGGGFSYSEVLTGDFQIIGADGTVSGTADGDGNEFIIRNDGDAGMSILAAEDSGETSSIIFGSASDLNGANIFYEYNTKTMKLGTQHASGILTLRSGNGSDAITIDASQNVGIGAAPVITGFNASLHIEGATPALIIRDSSGSAQATQFLTYYQDGTSTKVAFDHVGTYKIGTATAADMTGFSEKFILDDNSRISLSNNDSGTQNTVFGYLAGDGGGSGIDAGSNYNVFIGHNVAGGGTLNDATENTGVGYSALASLTSGDNNVAVGRSALLAITTGINNTAVGTLSLGAADGTESYNVAVGYNAMGNVNHDDADSNVCIGAYAGDEIGTNAFANSVCIGMGSVSSPLTSDASGVVAVGYESLKNLSSGQGNVAIGFQALNAEDDGDFNTAVGHQALTAQTGTSGTVGNTAVGYNAGLAITKGKRNTLLGHNALAVDDVGDYSTAIGDHALYYQNSDSDNEVTGNVGVGAVAGYFNVTGQNNTYLGYQAGKGASGQSNSNNTAVGSNALLDITTGSNNTCIGVGSGKDISSGAENVAVGGETCGYASSNPLTGTGNIVIGYQAGRVMEAASNSNILIGSGAGYRVTTADENVLIGTSAGAYITTDNPTTGIGFNALTALTSGAGNTAVGYSALSAQNTGSRNLAIGYQSMDAAANAEDDNISIGYDALGNMNNADSDKNIAIGNYAGDGIGTIGGTHNIFMGYDSGGGTWTGADSTNNIGIGNYTLDAAMNAAQYNIGIGYAALSAVTTADSMVAIGHNALRSVSTGTGQIAIGYHALLDTTGAGNVAVGHNAGLSLIEGQYNTVLGYNAFDAGQEDSQCVAIGYEALTNADVSDTGSAVGTHNVAVGYAAGDVVTTGTKNTLIGSATDPSANSGENQTVIGATTTGVADNSVTLGNADVTAVYMSSDSGAVVYNNGLYINRGGALGNFHTIIGTSNDLVVGVNGSGGDFIIKTNSGADEKFRIDAATSSITMPSQPAFLVHPASTQSNITTGSEVTIVFGTEIFDQGADFASNTFTAPVAGRYQFSFQLYLEGVDSAADYLSCTLDTSNRNYVVIFDPDFGQDPVYWTTTGTILADMDASDTAHLTIRSESGSAQVDVTTASYFSGFLAC